MLKKEVHSSNLNLNDYDEQPMVIHNNKSNLRHYLRSRNHATTKLLLPIVDKSRFKKDNIFSQSGNHFVQNIMLWGYYITSTTSSSSRTIKATKEEKQLSISEGIDFSRTIKMLTDFISINLTFDDNHCTSNDEHGGNNCHYDWGNVMNIELNVRLKKRAFEKDDRISGKFKVDYFVPWEFDCAICGEDCVLTVPVVNWDVQVPLPDCPLGNEDIPNTLQLMPGDSSPLDGVPLHVDGDLKLVTAGGEVAASAHVKVTIM